MYSNYSTKMEMEVSMQMKSGLSMKSNELSMCVFFNRQVMRSLGLNPTNKEITDLIAEVDKNGNQRLDFQEFVTFMSKHWHERDQEAELREAFRLFDRDNSGYITINELKQVMLNMGEKLNQEELEDMMREADVNRDGKLDYQEFVQKLLSTT
jgi:calmodulin